MTSSSTLRRVVLLLIVAAGLGAASYFGLELNSKNPAPKAAAGPVVVEATAARSVDLQDAITAIGTLRAAESVVMKSEISGRIEKISFADGARVKKGDVLISFDAAIQRAQVDQARAERDLAIAKLKRTQELFDKQFLSAAALDDAKANEKIVQARLALAQANLDKMMLRAPFDGVIGIRQVSVGDYIKEGVDVINLEDLSAMKADFRVPEQVSGRLRIGQSVNLESDAYPGARFLATVAAIDPSVDTAGRSVLMRATLKDASARLKPGMFVRVRLVLDTRPKAVVIPEESVVTQQGRLIIFKVMDGKAVSAPVRTGLRTTLDGKAVVEVVDGLAAGEMVVTAGQIKIRGNNVPVKLAEPPSNAGPVKGMPGNAAGKSADSSGNSSPPPAKSAESKPAVK
jgi:membrane fusion protein (multidrug efflux system)